MVAVSVQHADVNAVVERIIAASARVPEVTLRSRGRLLAAARNRRLLVAQSADAVAGWALAEPCGPGVNELGLLVVLPGFRDGDALRELTAVGVGLRRWSVVVTMDERFARWLVADWGFVRTGLRGITLKTRGMFLLRRLAPSRLRAALARVKGGSPIYLIRDGVHA